jgi:hypothetical protein
MDQRLRDGVPLQGQGGQVMKYTVYATQTKNYEIEVEAADESAAIASLDDWIETDFEDFEVTGGWEMVAK